MDVADMDAAGWTSPPMIAHAATTSGQVMASICWTQGK